MIKVVRTQIVVNKLSTASALSYKTPTLLMLTLMTTPLEFMLQPGQATEHTPNIGYGIYSEFNLVEISYKSINTDNHRHIF
jgi:hypothetical protein